MRIVFVIITLIISITTLSSKDDIFVVKGSTTVAPIANKFLDYLQNNDKNFKYKISNKGSGFGAKALINGTCDLACMSRFMEKDEFELAIKNGVLPVFHFITKDGIALVVNKSNPINSITMEQIYKIYTGKIKNWKDLGGKNEKIFVISRKKTSGTREVFDHYFLKNNEKFLSDTEVIGNKDIERLVIKKNNAIGYVGLGFLEGVKVLKVNGVMPNFETINDDSYPLTRPLYFVSNGYPPKNSYQYKMIQLARQPEGIEIIKSLGWYAPRTKTFFMIIKDLFHNYFYYTITIILIILALIFNSVYINNLYFKLNKNIKQKEAEISNRIKAEKALIESETKYTNFIRNFQGIAYQLDINNFQPILFNGAIKDITGYNSNDFLENKINWIDLVHQDDKNMFLEIRDKLKNSDNYLPKKEYRIITKDGSIKWIYDTSQKFWSLERKDDIIQGVIYDHTQQYEFKKALAESEKQFRTLIENSPFGIILLNKDGKILLNNNKIFEILNLNTQNLFNLNIQQLIKDNNIINNFSKCLETKNNLSYFNDYKNKFGRIQYLRYTFTPILSKNKLVKSVIIIIEDFSERKKLENELRRISTLESVGTLAAGIAHNIKNILASIALNIDIIELSPQSAKTTIERIKKSVHQAASITNRFQSFMKNSDVQKEVVDITKILLDADVLALSGSNIKSKLILEDKIWNVSVDPKQMHEVFLNLIINAKQAMPNGGEIIYKCYNKTLKNHSIGDLIEGDYVVIEIIDKGIGIPGDQLNKIFEPFFTTKKDGNGLGLSTVHYIIKKHNGFISVYSEIGEGTTFKIYLKAEINSNISEQNQNSEILKGNNEEILVMDDDDEILETLKELALHLNYKFTLVENGEKAIELYKNSLEKNNPFKAVILDLTNKKGWGGHQTINELKKIDPKVKAILFSGYSDEPIINNYKEYGFLEKLEKPVNLQELSIALKNVLNLENIN